MQDRTKKARIKKIVLHCRLRGQKDDRMHTNGNKGQRREDTAGRVLQ